MNRRTVALVGLAIVALPQLGFAQSNPQIGTWKLDLVKSKYPPVRSLALNIRQDGKTMIDTVEIIDVQGNTSTGVVMHVYDGLPHPATVSPDYDATVLTRVDANTLIFNRLKAGRLIQVGTFVVSQDGKTLTIASTGLDGKGQPLNTIAIFDKQ